MLPASVAVKWAFARFRHCVFNLLWYSAIFVTNILLFLTAYGQNRVAQNHDTRGLSLLYYVRNVQGD